MATVRPTMTRVVCLVLLVAAGAACRSDASQPTEEEARAFVDRVNEVMLRLGQEGAQAAWVQSTYITDDTQAIAARANRAYIDAIAALAKEAVRFDGIELAPDVRRQLDLLKLSLTMPAPANAAESQELTAVAARLEATYGKGKWCEDPARPDTCLDIDRVTNIMAESFDEGRLRRVWEGWHTIAPPMRTDFARLVELSNKGARELGFADTGAMWRSKYDMPAEAFATEVDRLWTQVRPLYVSLHAYVRMKLRARHGAMVPRDGPIPAHLLGNIWAQNWTNLYPILAPPGLGTGVDLTPILRARSTTPVEMVRIGERFYTSLGFAPLPDTFWERSLFARPRDREVVCHASAWDIDAVDDLRIKMCIEPRDEDFQTIHHELGHNVYQRAYNTLPAIFRDSAHDGFHEAIGDTVALSVTPEYLVTIGLLDRAPDASGDVGLLLSRALEKVAFLPFGLLIDQWRWKVFSGEITPADYNRTWWELRRLYQGVAPVTPRGEEHFDPGAKYHVPADVPYTRYFLAHVLQFQLHRELTRAAGCTAPLHRCSIYGNREAGARLIRMLSMGMSRPWPEALDAIAGSNRMDATAMLDYFAPLKTWLDAQIASEPVGW
jgi:peptidyl-dipeptidase A